MGLVLMLFLMFLKICISHQQVTPDVDKETRSPQVISSHVITEVSRTVLSEYQSYNEKLMTSLRGVVVLTCGPGWVYFEDHCYWFTRNEASWQDTRVFCESVHADLADITGFQENRVIKLVMRIIREKEHSSEIRYYFMGGTDAQREGHWIWINTGKSFGFTDWESGEPNNSGGNEDCIVMSGETHSAWTDVPCQHDFYGICKKSVEYKML